MGILPALLFHPPSENTAITLKDSKRTFSTSPHPILISDLLTHLELRQLGKGYKQGRGAALPVLRDIFK